MTCNRPQKLNISFDSDEQFRQFITLEAFLLGGRLRGIEHAQFSMVGTLIPQKVIGFLDRFAWTSDACVETYHLLNSVRPKAGYTLRDL